MTRFHHRLSGEEKSEQLVLVQLKHIGDDVSRSHTRSRSLIPEERKSCNAAKDGEVIRLRFIEFVTQNFHNNRNERP